MTRENLVNLIKAYTVSLSWSVGNKVDLLVQMKVMNMSVVVSKGYGDV